LVELKTACEGRVRDLLSGSFPLALAPGVIGVLREHLVADHESNRSSALATLVQEGLPRVKARLEKTLRAAQLEETLSVIEDVFGVRAPAEGPTDSGKASITDGDQVAAWLLGIIDHAVPAARGEMVRLVKELRAYQDELESLGERLAQAPDEGTLQTLFDQLKTASERLGELRAKRRGTIERLRRALWQAVLITRELRRLEDEASDSTTHALVVARAESVRTVLTEFAEKLTERKIQVLRQHFLEAFVRLARKEDLIVDAHIEPRDFSVSLIDRDGNKIPKQRLSAGEKQIYAIAMLEALARTSGRNLPVVIDTPLGRLDSKHRTKLVEHYFPTASHQVVILSTDTEVDEPFYRGLSRHISHAYHLEFVQAEGLTRASEGYFWRTLSEVGEHVA
jgi:DNA sulfur modification protein DndD